MDGVTRTGRAAIFCACSSVSTSSMMIASFAREPAGKALRGDLERSSAPLEAWLCAVEFMEFSKAEFDAVKFTSDPSLTEFTAAEFAEAIEFTEFCELSFAEFCLAQFCPAEFCDAGSTGSFGAVTFCSAILSSSF